MGFNEFGKRHLVMGCSGFFCISQRAAIDLGIKAGDRVAFLQDKQFPTDWYITKYDSKSGFLLEANKKGGLFFRSNSLSRAIAKASLKNVDFRNVLFQLSITEHGLALDVKNPKITMSTRK